MEISFEEKSLKYYKRVCETSLSHEETMEIIVPDTQPDIAAVIDTDGMAVLRSKEASNGRFSVEGVVDAFVIYRPEGGAGPRKLNIQMPFSVAGECPGLTNMGRLIVSCRLVGADSRIINSRKIVVKTEVCVDATAYVQDMLEYAVPASGNENYNKYSMQLLENTNTLRTIADVTEKTFNISEDLTLPSSKPPLGTVLKSRLRLAVEEAGSLGSKLIVKGNANVVMIYASAADGEIACADFKIPYSVILELDWDDDDLKFNTVAMATGFAVTENSGGGINVEIGGVLQAAVWRSCGINYISDAYSTDYDVELETENASIEMLVEKTNQNDTQRIVAEASRQPRSVLDAEAYIGRIRREGGMIRAPLTVKVIFIAEDGGLYSAAAKTEATRISDMKETVTAEPGELFASAAAAGVEVRVPLAYTVSRIDMLNLNMIVSASLKEDTPKNKADSPSIIVFRAGGRDNLWEIGKRYNTTRDIIRKVNGLPEGGEITAGDLVLVAKQK